MAAVSRDVIERYIRDAIAVEQAMAFQLREFARETGDDDEVRAALTDAERQSQKRAGILTARSGGEKPGPLKTGAANLFSGLPRPLQAAHVKEEQTVQNLIAAYTMHMSIAAMYKAIETVSLAASHSGADFASTALAESYSLAARLYHLIPTRAIIAYNMLTISEIDPAVETKHGEASWTG